MKLISLHPDFLTKPMAHRGLHGQDIPENSRAAFSAAISAGYGIELDLQLSADDEAMVFHDYDMKRLTGTAGPIRAITAQDLKRHRLSNGETIPTLAEVLALVAGRVPLLVEIKDQDGALGPDIGIVEKRTADLVNSYDGPLAVMSYNPHAVMALKEHAPDVPRGLVTEAFSGETWGIVPKKRREELTKIQDLEATGSCFVTHRHTHLDMPRIAKLKKAGFPVLCWTIKNRHDGETALKIADNITFEGYLP